MGSISATNVSRFVQDTQEPVNARMQNATYAPGTPLIIRLLPATTSTGISPKNLARTPRDWSEDAVAGSDVASK